MAAVMAVPKTPKQVLLEFYAQYQDAQKPSFQVMEVPGARPQDPVQYRATVICPAVHRGPGDLAFEDIMFEGAGRSKKVAEHDCSDKAWAYIRSLPGLKLPSGSLSLGVSEGVAAAGAQPQAPGAPPAMPAGPTLGASAPLGLTINDAMIEAMTPDQLKMALREVLGMYKQLVQAVHAESQRHSSELHAITMRQL